MSSKKRNAEYILEEIDKVFRRVRTLEEELKTSRRIENCRGAVEGEMCPICREPPRHFVSFACTHVVCTLCYERIDRCPLCKKFI